MKAIRALGEKCDSDKDPDMCRSLAASRIRDLESQIDYYKSWLKNLENKTGEQQ